MAHALLSPSSASRWLACTPSARLESQFPDTSGAAAAEGTLAHSLGELLLRKHLGLINIFKYKADREEIEKSQFYGSEMERYSEDYRDFVLERFAEAQATTSDARLFLEQKLDMTEYVPEGFGTGDCIIVADGTLDIIDLKYGKGVHVNAVENKQMMLYGLAAFTKFSIMYDIRTVRMTIYQPRLDNFSTFTMSADDLVQWAENDLKALAQRAFEGSGPFVPGKHCGFCKIKPQCKALAEYNLEIAKHDFADPALLSDDEISDILGRLELLTNWAGSVKDFALSQAIQGRKWTGYKLVEGRSVRKYIDDEEVAKVVLADKYPESDVFTKKIIGLTAMEKLLGKAKMAQLLSPFIVKPPGSPTLVPDTDKRPEYNAVAMDFSGDFIIH